MEILYSDEKIVVCIKPAGVPSTDEPGGLPELVRLALGDNKATVKTVHRLDQVVSGVMVLARTARAASDLSEQIRNHQFEKEYLAVVHGCPGEENGTFRDLLARNKVEKKTYIVPEAGKDTQEAVLDYRVLAKNGELSKVKIRLHTGRTHQIRAQFSGRGFPLVGDRKYGRGEDCNIALWSHRVAFLHPKTGERMEFSKEPPEADPWTEI